MASKKSKPEKSVPAPAKSAAKAKSTPARRTPVPRSKSSAVAAPVAAPAAPVEITYEMISKRAYEIWTSRGGNEIDNWFAAEKELRSI